MKPVWVLDDEPGMRWVLERALGKAGWEPHCFADGAALLAALDDLDDLQDPKRPVVLLSDVRMPGMDGFEVLAGIRARLPDLPVILMTAYTDLDTTVAAFSQGAFDYLAKPFDIQAAMDLISRAAQAARDSTTVPSAPEQEAGSPVVSADIERTEESGMLLSHSPAMQEVFRAIGRLAQSSVTVLITGESGTGKELVARALHQHSRRAAGPFVAVNAAAIPRDLLEAELFGHERGAFTGAVQMRKGRFEEADGGTLFLDEIGDMPAELQTRLLRVLAENSFYRVGGSRAIQVDVRIVAATHQPLEDRVQAGLFRADLFHRLNVIRLRLPALRARREDIETLARHFLARSAAQLGVPVRTLDPDALRALQQFDYPGNIRQLENICQWLTVMTASPQVHAQDLPPDIHADGGAPGGRSDAEPQNDWQAALAHEVRLRLQRQDLDLTDVLRQDFERVLLRQALALAGGQRGRAALMLGIGRNTLTRKCQELGLDPQEPPGA
ncbi:MAG: nitrogen regulation protein NR(I) [Castellaniella sp.]|uniref:nitrogen regulation protein NR(I) n=1 Tax=Castellaniella sp. TaxID=1955812 RepID=UPI003C78B6BF